MIKQSFVNNIYYIYNIYLNIYNRVISQNTKQNGHIFFCSKKLYAYINKISNINNYK